MDARLDTSRLLFTLTDYARHAEECLDWWKLNHKEDFLAIKRWLEESESIVTRYPAPDFPSCTFTLLKNITGTFKPDPFSRTWDKPEDGEAWRFSENEEIFFNREFEAEELRGYRVNLQGLLHELALVLGIKPSIDFSHFCFLRLGLLDGAPAYLAGGSLKTDFHSLFDLVMRDANNTVLFTIGSNSVTDFLKTQYKIKIRDITDYVRIDLDGAISKVDPPEKETFLTPPQLSLKITISDKQGNQYLVSGDCGSYYEFKKEKKTSNKTPIILRPLAKAYLSVLVSKAGKTLRLEELEKLALEEMKRINESEEMPRDTRISAAFRTTTDNGKKTTHSIYNAIIRGIAWHGGSYMLPEASLTKN